MEAYSGRVRKDEEQGTLSLYKTVPREGYLIEVAPGRSFSLIEIRDDYYFLYIII